VLLISEGSHPEQVEKEENQVGNRRAQVHLESGR